MDSLSAYGEPIDDECKVTVLPDGTLYLVFPLDSEGYDLGIRVGNALMSTIAYQWVSKHNITFKYPEER